MFKQKGFSVLKLIGGIVLVFFILLVIIVLIALDGGEKAEKIGEVSKGEGNETKEEKPQEAFAVGEKIKLKDYILVVNSTEPCVSDNEFMQPEDGNKFIVIDITQENDGSVPRSYNLWNFTLQDSEGYSHQTALATCKEPGFSSGTLQAGMKTRGYVTFEIAKENQPAKLIFTPSWLDDDQIIVNL